MGPLPDHPRRTTVANMANEPLRPDIAKKFIITHNDGKYSLYI